MESISRKRQSFSEEVSSLNLPDLQAPLRAKPSSPVRFEESAPLNLTTTAKSSSPERNNNYHNHGDSVDIFYKSRLPDLISSTPLSGSAGRPTPPLMHHHHHPSFALPPSLGPGAFLQSLPRSPFPQMSGIDH
jgi:hypothetical protein